MRRGRDIATARIDRSRKRSIIMIDSPSTPDAPVDAAPTTGPPRAPVGARAQRPVSRLVAGVAVAALGAARINPDGEGMHP